MLGAMHYATYAGNEEVKNSRMFMFGWICMLETDAGDYFLVHNTAVFILWPRAQVSPGNNWNIKRT